MASSQAPPSMSKELLQFLIGGHLALGDHVIRTSESADFRPVTKVNLGYIVAAVIFNEKNEVLLMQEAKRSCHGLWYLPAGRVEQGESMEEAVKREVEEETGLTFEPTTLLSVEGQGVLWYRFTYTGHVTGGTLKSPADKDAESLQAGWFPPEVVTQPGEEFPLRARDIIPLVQHAQKHRSIEAEKRHTPCLSIHTPHTHIYFRMLYISTGSGKEEEDASSTQEDYYYLRRVTKHQDNERLALPTIGINPCEISPLMTNMRLMKDVFSPESRPVSHVNGVISIEYTGTEKNDGLCLNLLCTVTDRQTPSIRPAPRSPAGYEWVRVTGCRELADCIRSKLQEGGSVPLMDLM